MDLKSLLGNNLRKYREDRNISREKFAEYVALEPATIKQIELGKRFVSSSSLEKICNFLGIEPKDLFDFKMFNESKEISEKIYDEVKYLEPKWQNYILQMIRNIKMIIK